MENIYNFLIKYWYIGILAVIILWEILRIILVRLLRKFMRPIKKVLIKLFGNAKIVSIELLVLLLIAIGVIAYLLITR
jgi:hypothetical protein